MTSAVKRADILPRGAETGSLGLSSGLHKGPKSAMAQKCNHYVGPMIKGYTGPSGCLGPSPYLAHEASEEISSGPNPITNSKRPPFQDPKVTGLTLLAQQRRQGKGPLEDSGLNYGPHKATAQLHLGADGLGSQSGNSIGQTQPTSSSNCHEIRAHEESQVVIWANVGRADVGYRTEIINIAAQQGGGCSQITSGLEQNRTSPFHYGADGSGS